MIGLDLPAGVVGSVHKLRDFPDSARRFTVTAAIAERTYGVSAELLHRARQHGLAASGGALGTCLPLLPKADEAPAETLQRWNNRPFLGRLSAPRELESASCTCPARHQAESSQFTYIL